MVLIGCGGVSSGEDAYRKIRAGGAGCGGQRLWAASGLHSPTVVCTHACPRPRHARPRPRHPRTPTPTHAQAPASCSCTPRWRTRAPRSCRASRLSWRRSSSATASRAWRRLWGRTTGRGGRTTQGSERALLAARVLLGGSGGANVSVLHLVSARSWTHSPPARTRLQERARRAHVLVHGAPCCRLCLVCVSRTGRCAGGGPASRRAPAHAHARPAGLCCCWGAAGVAGTISRGPTQRRRAWAAACRLISAANCAGPLRCSRPPRLLQARVLLLLRAAGKQRGCGRGTRGRVRTHTRSSRSTHRGRCGPLLPLLPLPARLHVRRVLAQPLRALHGDHL